MSQQHYLKWLGEKLIGKGYRSSLVSVGYAFDDAETKVIHFDLYRLRASAGVLPIDGDGNVYLLNEFVPSAGEWQLGIARGGIEVSKNESPEVAARRELQEEMGLACDTLTPLWAGYAAPNASDWHYTLFLGEGLLDVVKGGGDEVYPMDVVKVPLREAVAMVKRGEIKSSAAAIAILMAGMERL
ncbi:MAG: NUDIX hydrolase [Alphaproteobacteria bacterium]